MNRLFLTIELMNGEDFKRFFPDYNKERIYQDYSIEYEVSFAHKDIINKEFWTDLRFKNESDKILEIVDIHNMNKSSQKKIYSIVQDIYMDWFPIGSDSRLSGGNHFHITIPREWRDMFTELFSRIWYSSNWSSLTLFNKYIEENLWGLQRWLGLYQKIYNRKFYTRPFPFRNSRFDKIEVTMCRDDQASYKWWFVMMKSSYWSSSEWCTWYSSLEFRWNNVIDTRLYGFYLWCLKAAIFWDFGTDIIKENLKDIYTDDSYYTWNEISLYSLQLLWRYSNIDNKNIENIKAFLIYLYKDYPKAAIALREYLSEHWIQFRAIW